MSTKRRLNDLAIISGGLSVGFFVSAIMWISEVDIFLGFVFMVAAFVFSELRDSR